MRRPTILAHILLALPGIPVMMFVVPPLFNARSTRLNMVALGLIAFFFITWALNVLLLIKTLAVRREVNRLLNH